SSALWVGASMSREFAQNLNPALERLVGGRVGDAQVCVALAEHAAWDYEQVVFDRFGDELRSGAPGRTREQVERAAGGRELVIVLEARDEQIALALVVLDDARHVEIHCGNTRVLHHARRADERELLELRHLLNQPLRAVRPPQAPTGHAVRLA